jgi:uncharacterized membrane protein
MRSPFNHLFFIGLIFLNAAAGAASGALTDVGINEHFMKEDSQ